MLFDKKLNRDQQRGYFSTTENCPLFCFLLDGSYFLSFLLFIFFFWTDCKVRICRVSSVKFFTVPILCRGRCPVVIFAYDGRFLQGERTQRGQTDFRDDERVSFIDSVAGRTTFRQSD